jgi:hypothetical protein
MISPTKLLIATLSVFTLVSGFSIGGSKARILPARFSEPVSRHLAQHKLQLSSNSEEKGGMLSSFNPLYGSLWAAFLAFGLFLSPGSIGDPADTAILQAYIENPTAPEGINPIFLIIFNSLGVMPLIIAQLACPQGSKEGLPATPFLGAALGMGFGAAGLYLTLRDTPVDRKSQAEASWFTRYILENKITSVIALGLLALGVQPSVSIVDHQGWATAVSEFVALVEQSKFVSVSSLDLAVLTIAAATLIPRDLQLRTPEAETAEVGRTIAILSLFFPIVGAASYCLWRPSLPAK